MDVTTICVGSTSNWRQRGLNPGFHLILYTVCRPCFRLASFFSAHHAFQQLTRRNSNNRNNPLRNLISDVNKLGGIKMPSLNTIDRDSSQIEQDDAVDHTRGGATTEQDEVSHATCYPAVPSSNRLCLALFYSPLIASRGQE